MEIFILSILILLNGFFALSEIALVSSKKSRLDQYSRQGKKGAKIALKLLEKSENFLSAIQVGITLIGIVTGVYGGMNIADDVAPYFMQYELTSLYAHEIALILTVLIITYVSIVIGELVPKTVALSNPEKIAIRVAPAIYYFNGTFYPFVRLLAISTNIFNKLLGIKKNGDQLTEAELRHIIKTASDEGVIEKEQNIIHEKVFYFSYKKAKHIMTHRMDLEWIDLDKPIKENMKILSGVNHSKIICCKGELDHFVGVLYLKDFYKSIAINKNNHIEELLTEPLVVPENADARKVLELLRFKNNHICFVVNEYGGFEGVITLHDIIENIVGEIPDEGDSIEPDVFVREDNSILINGDAPVETLTEIIENYFIDFDKIEYSTVAGFVINHIEKMPATGDKFDFNGYHFEIVDMDGNRIDKLLISKIQSI